MGTRTKWVWLVLGVCAGTMLTASCTPDSTSPLDQTVKSSNEPSFGKTSPEARDEKAWVGKYHNDALAYALVKIKQNNGKSKQARCQAGLAALKDFQKAFAKASARAGFDDLNLTDGMCDAAQIDGLSLSVSVPDKGLQPSNDISSAAVNYMNQIISAADVMSSVPSLSFAVNTIQNSAFSALPSLESGAVAGTGSTAVSSATYWVANESSWSGGPQTAYSQSSIVAIPPSMAPKYGVSTRTRAIIKADIAAFVTIMVGEWWLGDVAVGHACVKAAAASLVTGLMLLT